jgi:putative ABC transport system permease protein
MTFQQFAFNNVRRNARQYSAYFLSSVFSVMVFFIYAAFMFHPALRDEAMNPIVLRAVILAEVVIFVFSFLFIFYSLNTFIKTRQKEFGILTVLGISTSQLNKLIVVENMVLGITSVAAGIALGALFTKLFFMILSVILNLEASIPFYLAKGAFVVTIISFACVFLLASIVTLFSINKNEAVKMLRQHQDVQKTPSYSVIIAIAAIIAIVIAYFLAASANLFEIMKRMIPILVLISIGTFFFYKQTSIGIIAFLKKRPSYFWSTNMLTVSDLAYKMKNNARVLFFVTILSAVAITSSSALMALYQSSKNEVEARTPHAISVSMADQTDVLNDATTTIKNFLKKEHIAYEDIWVQLIPAAYPVKDKMITTSLLSKTDYEALTGESLDLKKDGAVLVSATPDEGFVLVNENNQAEVSANGMAKNYYLEILTGPVLTPSTIIQTVMVIPDEDYADFSKGLAVFSEYYGVTIPDWTKHQSEILQLQKSLQDVKMSTRAENLYQTKQATALFFFIGIFISCLFFLAAASVLYFRLYNDLDSDMKHYHSLYRIGLTIAELKKIVFTQLKTLFFVPFTVAVLHSLFAMRSMQNMMSGNAFGMNLLLLSFYLIIQILFYFFIKGMYVKKLSSTMM